MAHAQKQLWPSPKYTGCPLIEQSLYSYFDPPRDEKFTWNPSISQVMGPFQTQS
jgi:hypothetical protein